MYWGFRWRRRWAPPAARRRTWRNSSATSRTGRRSRRARRFRSRRSPTTSSAVSAKETRALIRTAQGYVSFFGHAPPAGVDFSTDWVIFYAAGTRPTGGFDASVAVAHARRRPAGRGDALVSPGPDCIVAADRHHAERADQVRGADRRLDAVLQERQRQDCGADDPCAAVTCRWDRPACRSRCRASRRLVRPIGVCVPQAGSFTAAASRGSRARAAAVRRRSERQLRSRTTAAPTAAASASASRARDAPFILHHDGRGPVGTVAVGSLRAVVVACATAPRPRARRRARSRSSRRNPVPGRRPRAWTIRATAAIRSNGGADCGGICQCIETVSCIIGDVFDSSPGGLAPAVRQVRSRVVPREGRVCDKVFCT